MNEWVIPSLWDKPVQSALKVSNYAIIRPSLPHPGNPKDIRVGPVFNLEPKRGAFQFGNTGVPKNCTHIFRAVIYVVLFEVELSHGSNG